MPNVTDLFCRPEQISLLLRLPERSIDVRAIRARLSQRFDGNLKTNAKVLEIDSGEGRLRTPAGWQGPHDFIINASYTDLNLGLPLEKQFRVKYGLTALVLARTSIPAAAAVTIMDGAFISVYPAYGGLHTLSSVVHTHFRRYSDHREFAAAFPERFRLAQEDNVMQRIGDHVREHLNLNYTVEDLWVTAKAKLATDKGDSRVTEVRKHERLLSVLCGKLDAVFAASDAILKEIK